MICSTKLKLDMTWEPVFQPTLWFLWVKAECFPLKNQALGFQNHTDIFLLLSFPLFFFFLEKEPDKKVCALPSRKKSFLLRWVTANSRNQSRN